MRVSTPPLPSSYPLVSLPFARVRSRHPREYEPADTGEIFVDVEGDKYLARIVRTFPPKALTAKLAAGAYPLKPGISAEHDQHPLAVDLDMDTESVEEVDDPMAYFYNVRLITETDPEDEGVKVDYASSTGQDAVIGDGNGTSSKGDGDEEEAEAEAKWGGSVMEVKADQLSYVLHLIGLVRTHLCQVVVTGATQLARHLAPKAAKLTSTDATVSIFPAPSSPASSVIPSPAHLPLTHPGCSSPTLRTAIPSLRKCQKTYAKKC